MTRSMRIVGVMLFALVVALVQVPASAAAPPPEPYRVATGLDGYVGATGATLGDRVFWILYGNSGTGSQDSHLWTSDGTPAGTREFFDPNPTGIGWPSNLHQFGNGFVFTATDGIHGQEVWYSDGTSAGTRMIADLSVGSESTSILGASSAAVYIGADDGVHGSEIYRWTGPGTVPQLFDINTTVRMTSDPELQVEWQTTWTNSSPFQLGMIGDTLYFSADQTIRTAAVSEWGDHHVVTTGTGRELWRLGPTGAPVLVKDITSTNAWGEPDPRRGTNFARETETAVMGGSLYFLTEGTDSDFSGPELWRTNGTAAGTSQVASLKVPFLEDHWDFEPVTAGGKLFYRSWNGDWDGIWATSGTNAGQRVSPAGDAGIPVALGAGVVFSLEQAASGREPWYSIGTSSTQLGNLRPGAAGSIPFPITTWGSHAYFGANDGSGRNLYRTDGTAAGTQRVYDLPNVAGAVSDGPMIFYGAAKLLYFLNSPDNDRNVGNELWVFDPNREITAKTTSTILRASATVAYGTGGTATITVNGAGGPPTGTVTIRDGTKVLGTVPLVNGRANFALPKNLAVGSHSLTATYSGSAAHLSSVSSPVKVVVKVATKLTGKVNDLTFGPKEKIRVIARLKTTPVVTVTGKMYLYIDGKRAVTATLAAKHKNTVTLVSKPLKRGKHTIQLRFANSPNATDARTGVVRIEVVK